MNQKHEYGWNVKMEIIFLSVFVNIFGLSVFVCIKETSRYMNFCDNSWITSKVLWLVKIKNCAWKISTPSILKMYRLAKIFVLMEYDKKWRLQKLI